MGVFLDYQFRDESLLAKALTHRSANANHNERLEFLGDAILGFVVGEFLYRKFPLADEGQLTRTRASLVNKNCLANIAREIDLGPRLQLGDGERKSGGWRRDSILSNALEALIGAIYLDGGIDACRHQLELWFADRFANTDPSQSSKDAKTCLQEYLQSRGLALPVYNTVEVTGPAHHRIFVIACAVSELDEAPIGRGESRRKGEQQAAELALKAMLSESKKP